MKNTLNLFPQNVIYGKGALEGSGDLFAGRKLFLLSDEGIRSCGLLEKAERVLRPERTYLIPRREPRLSDAQDALDALASSGCDAVAGVGGGSVLDVAKAAAAAYGSSKAMRQLIGVQELKRILPLALIPTTAGTGSEATCNAIFIDDADGVKKAVISSAMIPDAAVLDPALTAGLPPAITAFTGVDALCHLAESFISVNANELSRAWSARGMELVLGNLARCTEHPEDLDARQNMLFASLFGGAALRIAGTAAVHALAYPLGKRGVPHGVANSMLFGSVMERTLKDVRARLPRFDDMLSMIRGLPLPTLKAYDVHMEELDVLAQESMEQTRLLNNHPVKVDIETAREIYAGLFA